MSADVQVLQGYKLYRVFCPQGCGMLAMMRRAHSARCRAHDRGVAEKFTDEVVCMLQHICAVLDMPFCLLQQYPLALRGKDGRFMFDKRARVDLVLAHHGRLLGVEVHGAKEHAADQHTMQLDALKQEAWARKGRSVVGALCVVWGHGVREAATGKPVSLTYEEWYDDTAEMLHQAVITLIACK